MPDNPILVFPQANISERSKKAIALPTLTFPGRENQVHRFINKVGQLEQIFNNETLRFAKNIQGLIPEMVLVFEIAGTIDEFFKAVDETPGMEYLTEFQDEFLEQGSGFYYRALDGKILEKEIERRVFVSLTNQRGISEILSYWNAFRYGENFRRGTAKFRSLFSQLIDLRPYSLYDRLKDTGFAIYLNDLRQYPVTSLKFEIEFVFHQNAAQRNAIIQEVNSSLEDIGGRIINNSITIVSDIKYFGAIAEAPIEAFDDLSNNASVVFLQSHRILFFKPVGQSISRGIDREGEDVTDNVEIEQREVNEPPIVAMLDGMPLENHRKLINKLTIDDPDGFSNNYSAAHRIHGTSMASLILYGDLDNPSTITSRLYVRPILRLVNDGGENFIERLPEDKLVIDLIHRSIVRMFEAVGEEEAVAPEIKIINFSIGDLYRPFIKTMSTWAKLLDYLSYKYKVLFIISAGNYNEDISLPVSLLQLEALNDEQRQELFYQALFEKNYDRKILTPSESVNGLTVGALHVDGSTFANRSGIFNPCSTNDLPCLFSRIGYGFNRSLKPDIIFDGGRTIYRITNSSQNQIVLKAANHSSNYPPGIKIAIPGQQGDLNKVGFGIGTSDATALITNKACKLYELLEGINQVQQENQSNIIPKSVYAVLIKTLLVHYSDSGVIEQKLTSILQNMPGISDKIIKEYIYQNSGYGVLNKSAFGICTEKRVTVIGFGRLRKDEGHIYKFPLPNILSGKRVAKTLKISLGWLTPLNYNSGKYKMAHLYFDNINSSQTDLLMDREGADYNISRRGTIQHDILYNDSADVYIRDSELAIKVNCREFASGLHTRNMKYEVEYGLAVTMELNEEVDINIYNEIRSRLSQKVKIPGR